MNRKDRKDELLALRPVGLALASVVAGLSSAAQAEREVEPRAHAPLEPAGQSNVYMIDPTNHPGFEEDPSLVFGASEPADVLAGVSADEQGDLFGG